MTEHLIEIAYLTASVLFIVGIKGLGSPRTARRGITMAQLGMAVAVVAALVHRDVVRYEWIVAGIVTGAVIGAVLALKIQMTAMPQMVALLNGLGGSASALVGASEFARRTPQLDTMMMATIGLSILIGSATFTGSIVAFAKLQELMRGAPLVYPFQRAVNLVLLVLTVGVGGYLVLTPSSGQAVIALAVLACLLGVLVVLPIGGADMPVVIAILNALSGLAATATGFVLSNNVLIIAGALVGSSGIVLSQLMCQAMNRSLGNVLFGAFGQVATPGTTAVTDQRAGTRTARSGTAEEAAIILEYAKLVVIAPGYGMAVAQAQHSVKELADLLQQRGVTVKYAIHPVAGRMPGHMNVLLAEANVPYEQLCDMDEINPEFGRTDVALVIGANDVTNPAARYDKSSPIYGMPILDVDKAKTVLVCKRSLNPGFAGIDNELYYRENTMMLFGDAKGMMVKLVQALKSAS